MEGSGATKSKGLEGDRWVADERDEVRRNCIGPSEKEMREWRRWRKKIRTTKSFLNDSERDELHYVHLGTSEIF